MNVSYFEIMRNKTRQYTNRGVWNIYIPFSEFNINMYPWFIGIYSSTRGLRKVGPQSSNKMERTTTYQEARVVFVVRGE